MTSEQKERVRRAEKVLEQVVKEMLGELANVDTPTSWKTVELSENCARLQAALRVLSVNL